MIDINHLIEAVDFMLINEKRDSIEIDSLSNKIKEIIVTDKENSKILGSLLGKLSRIKKTLPSSNSLNFCELQKQNYSAFYKKSNWVKVGNGFLKIGHKPGGKKCSFKFLYNEGTTSVLTILSEREGAFSIGENFKKLDIDWIWLPLSDGKIPSYKMNEQISQIFETIKEKLNKEERIYIHCSAGLHRTGMITNALLIYIGYDALNSLELLRNLRPITAFEVREHRRAWGLQFAKYQIFNP